MRTTGITVSCIVLLFTSFAVSPSVGRLSPHRGPSVSDPAARRTADVEMVVLPITQLKIALHIEAILGTGFCLDPSCRFIVTNYHVAILTGSRKINGQTVIHRYLATGPNDEGATVNEGPALLPMKYNLSRDLAVFELRDPLRGYHGPSFYPGDLQIGQPVEIYSYPTESLLHTRKLLQVHGTFKGQTPSGLLAFDYDVGDGKSVRPGASGGIVMDSKTRQVVGVLNAIAGDGKAIACAVTLASLQEFVSSVQPFLAQGLFPSSRRISPISADAYAKFVPPSALPLQHRPAETSEIHLLRAKAQLLADGMRDFIAVQTLAWGSADHPPLVQSQYEVQVVDGYQQFRELPDGKKELQNVPVPSLSTSMVPGDEWSTLPARVGADLNLEINPAADVFVNGQWLKVFQYAASVEDAVCVFKFVSDFAFFMTSKAIVVPCYGEVWTDQDLNILRMSEHLVLSGNWQNPQAIVTYGWLKKADEPPRLIPLTIAAQAEYRNKLYWCRGQFTDYRQFTARAKWHRL